ncbi:methyl-accepting chemotaxis protein [Ferrovibrio terrae]|uniref:methyl-accepting chemotaxis protein n=1 Tax=Ferrovibrio terrae TaxID=2594003 RepID=UPI003137F269
MRIRNSFMILMLLIAVIVLGVTGVMIREAFNDRQSAVMARGLAEMQGSLMRTNELIGIERGADNAALFEARIGDPKSDTLAKPRAATDEAFKTLLAQARALQHPAVDLRRIEQAQATVLDWRKKVDAALVRPLPERPQDVLRGYAQAFIDLVGSMTPALNAHDAAISQADSDVAATMVVARLAADLRATGSARATPMTNVIVSGKPIPPEVLLRYHDFNGRIAALWDRVTMTMQMIDASPALKAEVDKTYQAYFKTIPGMYDEILAGSDKGGQWPFTVAEFRARHNPQLYFAGFLRDAAVTEALRIADNLIAQRTQALMIQGGVILAALLLLLGGAIFFLRRVVSPLGSMTATMTRIAEGHTAQIGYGDRSDEIGDMAKALGIFQRNAEEKTRLEADERGRAEADRVRMTEQRDSEAAISREIAQFCIAIGAGDVSRRIDLAGKDGVFRDLSQQMNGLADTLQGVLADLGRVLRGLSEGDLTITTSGQYQGAFGSLADAARETVTRLRDFAARLGESANTVRDASGEISTGSQDLASRTEAQAASIEETAASMHEITATVKQNADNAQAANQLAVAARDTAEKGGSVVAEAVTAVTQIESSAKKISDIVGLIDEIAFQTNLLALNASVEAARAGEAGKGFAVVAQEVRALAQRSANASKDIKALIQESNSQVKTGADLVGRTGASLTEIVTAIKKVSDIVAEIAAASREQATGLEQINTAVGNMDEMTQRNGALVEETSASAQNLANQAGELSGLVGFFKTGGDAAVRSPAAPIAVAKPAAVRPVAKPALHPVATAAKPAAKAAPKPAPAPAARPAPAPAGGDDDWQEF